MTLHSTVGGVDSNSYASVAEANIYFASRYHISFWEDLDTVDKENLLITVTSLLDWYVKWNGLPYTEEQALCWPRTGVYSELGNEYASDVVPAQVKTALYELVVSSYEEDRTNDTGLEGLSMLKLSSLQIQTTDKYANPSKKVIPEKIFKILFGLCTYSGVRVVRLIRA